MLADDCMLGKNRIISIQDIHLPGRRDSISITELEKQMISSIKMGLVEETNNALNAIRDKIVEREYVTLEKMRLIGLELSILLIKEAENWNILYHKSYVGARQEGIELMKKL